MCGNQGINNYSQWSAGRNTSRRWMRSFRFGVVEKMRYHVVMRESRKPDAPKDLTRLIQKFKIAKENLIETETEFRLFKKKMRNEPVKFKEAEMNIRRLRNNVWRRKCVVDGCRRAITYFPIVPIIIPTPIDIN
tara:strand:- start:45 stop:446 length:402 start_codon:yes stop_codon:yes gene_type:complete